MTQRNLSIRLSLKDSEVVKRALEEVGQTGGRSLNIVGDSAQTIGPQLDQVQRRARDAGAGLGTLGGAAGVSARALEGVRRAADPLHAAQARLGANTRLLNAALEAGQIDAAEYALRLQQLQGRFHQFAARQMAATEASRTFAVANDNVARSSGRMGGIMQQVGFQVGDAATQISMGGSAMQALAVQGSQLLGVFGPWGAVIGAAVVVTSALASAIFGAGKETESAKKATVSYGDAIKEAQEFTRSAAEQSRFLHEERRKEKLATLEAAMAEEQLTLSRARGAAERASGVLERLTEVQATGRDVSGGIARAQATLDGLGKISTDTTARIAELQKQMSAVNAVSSETSNTTTRTARGIAAQRTETEALVDGVTAYIGDLKEQTRLMRLDADEREKVEAVMRAQNVAMKEGNLLTEDQIALIRKEIDAQQDLRDANAEQRRAEDEARRDAERKDREVERYREQAAREAEGTTDRVVDYASGSFEEYPAAVLADPEIGKTLLEILS